MRRRAPDEEKIFYMDPGFSVPDNSDLLELDTDDGRCYQEEEISNTFQQELIPGTGSRKLLQSELIDKFIQANPRIEPVRDSSRIVQLKIFRNLLSKEKVDLLRKLLQGFI